MTIGAIWARAHGGVIGRDGTMPWRLPEDLRHFAEVTAGQAVVMGRRTWDSIPERYRPLAGRRNLVQTRDPAWSAPGATGFATVDDGVRLAEGLDLWVIGGRRTFDAWAALVERAEVTEIDLDVAGDTYAPRLAMPPWRLLASDPATGWHTSTRGLRYRFDTLVRAERS
ncbi:MAG: dihydrofolate reductase [Bifidobacteriaceae bacterium]|jgi:dihydrofolate reductase|nr:dihydrofolate reductase [Bifidobacteriaceae bacterium]